MIGTHSGLNWESISKMKPYVSHGLFLGAISTIGLVFFACKPDEVKYKFPHKPHIQQEIACDACHELKETGVTMPAFETCTTCHEADSDALKSCKECHAHTGMKEIEKAQIVSHQKLMKPYLPKGWSDVQFQHAKYLKEKTDCYGCHAHLKESVSSTLKNLPTMDQALKFNRKAGIPTNCEVCHLEISRTVPPASHDARWKTQHGRLSVFSDRKQCLLCHEEETCTTCHTVMKPKDHTNLWRRKTHGIQAEFDRSCCMVCHREDQCSSCHRATADPIPAAAYHTPDASCLSCHSPLAAQGPQPRPPLKYFKPMPHRMMMGVTGQRCLECHTF